MSRKWKQKGKQWLRSRRFYLNEKKSNKFRIILNYLLGNWTKKKKKKKVAYRLGIGFVQLNGSLNELVPRSYVNHCCAAEKSREQLIQVNLYMNRYVRREECLPFFCFVSLILEFVGFWRTGLPNLLAVRIEEIHGARQEVFFQKRRERRSQISNKVYPLVGLLTVGFWHFDYLFTLWGQLYPAASAIRLSSSLCLNEETYGLCSSSLCLNEEICVFSFQWHGLKKKKNHFWEVVSTNGTLILSTCKGQLRKPVIGTRPLNVLQWMSRLAALLCSAPLLEFRAMIVNLQLMNNQLYLHVSTEQDWTSHSFNLVLNQTSALHRGILALFDYNIHFWFLKGSGATGLLHSFSR